LLTNGALASNVFWACRSANLGTSTEFRGVILADQTITNAGSSIFEGRQLAFTADITFNGAAFAGVGVPGSFAPPTATSTVTPSSTMTATSTQTPGATASATQTQTPGLAVPSPVAKGNYIYPSPSTGSSARIVYTMESAGSVKIKIYNETGRLVDSIEEAKGPGLQGSDVNVGRFASGTYYYVLTQVYSGSSEVQSTRKFIVLH
jgi:hypothetical protein